MEASSSHCYLQEVTLLDLLLNFKCAVVKIPPRVGLCLACTHVAMFSAMEPGMLC